MFYRKLKTCILILGLAGVNSPVQAQNKPANDKWKPVDNSSAPTIPCPEYGPKFFRAAGSTVCLKVEGMVRGETQIRQNRSSLENKSTFQSRAELGFDARARTDYGPVRVVVTARGITPATASRP